MPTARPASAMDHRSSVAGGTITIVITNLPLKLRYSTGFKMVLLGVSVGVPDHDIHWIVTNERLIFISGYCKSPLSGNARACDYNE